MSTEIKLANQKYIDVIGPFDDPEKYGLVKEIGSGVSGVVYYAENLNKKENEDDFYAVKILKQTFPSDFIQESDCLKEIYEICNSVGVICYKDSFITLKDKSVLYVIVTPYLQNYFTLNQFLQRNILFSVEDIIKIYEQIVNVKNKLTELCLCHSDLNINNIMINPKNLDVKVIDFGLCLSPEEEIINVSAWNMELKNFVILRKLLVENFSKNFPEHEKNRVENYCKELLEKNFPIENYKKGCVRKKIGNTSKYVEEEMKKIKSILNPYINDKNDEDDEDFVKKKKFNSTKTKKPVYTKTGKRKLFLK